MAQNDNILLNLTKSSHKYSRLNLDCQFTKKRQTFISQYLNSSSFVFSMKKTKVKQVEGQSSLKTFFKPKEKSQEIKINQNECSQQQQQQQSSQLTLQNSPIKPDLSQSHQSYHSEKSQHQKDHEQKEEVREEILKGSDQIQCNEVVKGEQLRMINSFDDSSLFPFEVNPMENLRVEEKIEEEQSNTTTTTTNNNNNSNFSGRTDKEIMKEAKDFMKYFTYFLEKKHKLIEINLLQQLKPVSLSECELYIQREKLAAELKEFQEDQQKLEKEINAINKFLGKLNITPKQRKIVDNHITNAKKESGCLYNEFTKYLVSINDQFLNKYFKSLTKQSLSNPPYKENKLPQQLPINIPSNLSFKITMQVENNQTKKFEENLEQARERYKVIKYSDFCGNKIEIQPTQEQLDVIVSDIKKDMKIIACAGSGKTTTLVLRIKYLLERGVKPESIIVSTFNIEAGKLLSSKIQQMIGNQLQQNMIIGNIDKIAYRFIRDQIEQKQKVTSQVLLVSQREYGDIWLSHIKRHTIQYMKYRYFIFDEFQDVSELQYQIILEFKKLGCILTVVGDDAQSIYGFRETQMDIIQRRFNEDIARRNKELNEFRLSTNYRCTGPITAFANSIIEKSENLIQKKMESYHSLIHKSNMIDSRIHLPYVHIYQNEKDQNEKIIQLIIKMVISGEYRFKDIVVLGAMNEQLKSFEESLEKHNQQIRVQSELIPYQAFITLKLDEFKLVDFYQVQNLQEDKITISTIHRAKGLEWKVVFFIGCNDDSFPMAFVNKNKINGCNILEEQRRLFYVGVTRAIQQLHFGCIGKESTKLSDKDVKGGRYKLSRFFADVPQNLYQIDDIASKQEHLLTEYQWIDISYDSYEGCTDIKVKDAIASMSSKSLEEINQFIVGVNSNQSSMINLFNDHYQLPGKIKENQQLAEMAMFIDRYIIRKIGDKYKISSAFNNQLAVQVILPTISELKLSDQMVSIYLKNCKWFGNMSIKESQDVKLLIEKFKKENPNEKSEQSLKEFKDLIHQISVNAEMKGLKPIQFLNYKKHKPNRFFEEEFERIGSSFISALVEYMDISKQTEDIMESVYKIAKCGLLIEKRRKYLHNQDMKGVIDKTLLLLLNSQFVDGYLAQFSTSIECKKVYKSKYLTGQVDLICGNELVIFFKFDQFESLKKEDLLFYLFTAGHFKVTLNIPINRIGILNMLSGNLQILDISSWKLQQPFIDKIEECGQSLLKERIEQIEGRVANDQVIVNNNNDNNNNSIQVNADKNLDLLNQTDSAGINKTNGSINPIEIECANKVTNNSKMDIEIPKFKSNFDISNKEFDKSNELRSSITNEREVISEIKEQFSKPDYDHKLFEDIYDLIESEQIQQSITMMNNLKNNSNSNGNSNDNVNAYKSNNNNSNIKKYTTNSLGQQFHKFENSNTYQLASNKQQKTSQKDIIQVEQFDEESFDDFDFLEKFRMLNDKSRFKLSHLPK